MSKTAPMFFTLLLVLASCFIAGCSSIPLSGTPPAEEPSIKTDVGFSGNGQSEIIQRLRFEDTVAKIFTTDLFDMENDIPVNITQENVSSAKHIKNIRGSDLDENGGASSWTFVVKHSDKFSIVTYNNRGGQISTTPGTLSQPEIFTDGIISPRSLFEKNRATILNSTRGRTTITRDLSLGGGFYTLSISGHGTPVLLVFDAKTGVLTSSND
jgi:hypothetical protein